ncbi:glycosyltransferase [Advenella sp. RU8]|uniref:glycosyltransferase n=1 Tax=Advenella sp. RU8 TaxID=3399575 RepID=UPI003AAE8D5A
MKLILIGRYEIELDPLKEETMKIIKNNKNIIELGFQIDVKKYLSIMDLFVSPSYREGFGLSVLEANLMGVPVLVSKITGHSEIVIEGRNGFFVTKKDAIDLKNKMQTLLKSKEYLISMKNNCRTEVIKNYNHNDVLKQALSYYSQFK